MWSSNISRPNHVEDYFIEPNPLPGGRLRWDATPLKYVMVPLSPCSRNYRGRQARMWVCSNSDECTSFTNFSTSSSVNICLRPCSWNDSSTWPLSPGKTPNYLWGLPTAKPGATSTAPWLPHKVSSTKQCTRGMGQHFDKVGSFCRSREARFLETRPISRQEKGSRTAGSTKVTDSLCNIKNSTTPISIIKPQWSSRQYARGHSKGWTSHVVSANVFSNLSISS